MSVTSTIPHYWGACIANALRYHWLTYSELLRLPHNTTQQRPALPLTGPQVPVSVMIEPSTSRDWTYRRVTRKHVCRLNDELHDWRAKPGNGPQSTPTAISATQSLSVVVWGMGSRAECRRAGRLPTYRLIREGGLNGPNTVGYANRQPLMNHLRSDRGKLDNTITVSKTWDEKSKTMNINGQKHMIFLTLKSV